MLYVVMSLPLGGWLARIPEIRTAIRADDRSWGFANGVAGIGEFVGFVLILVAVGKYSTRRLTVLAAALALLFMDRLLAHFGWQRIFRVSMLASGAAFVAPLLTGLLAQRFGLGWALVPVVLSLAACFLISFTIREVRLAG